jgi:Iap family predicted aminopeptidase
MKRARLGALCLLMSAAVLTVSAQTARPLDPLDVVYRDVAGQLVTAALADNGGYNRLAYLTTRIGNRLSGSASLDRAIEWLAAQMKADGLSNVQTQPVKVPHWVRGAESAQVVRPIQRSISMLGLGPSVATPAEGITAPVVVVASFAELESLGADKVKGKIVLYDMPWEDYARTVTYRSTGPSRAARLGAVAALVRSVTPRSINSPHTGALTYNPASPSIPAEEVHVQLKMAPETRPDADSANVFGEIIGSERPDEVVVVGGHLDSWDVGQGAHDDGAGVMAAWRAVVLMKELGLKPRRTIRVVAWTNEENGSRGGAAYRAALGAAVDKHVAAIEMDQGAERPIGFAYDIAGIDPATPRMLSATARLREIGRLLTAIGASGIATGGGETDIAPLMREGVPGFGLITVNEHYFDWHHTNADTLDKVDLQDFRRCIASLAVMAYVLADMPGRL